MRYVFVAVTILLAVALSGSTHFAASPQSQQPSSAQYRALVDQYCVTCHNQRSKTANVTFDTMDLANLSKDAKTWERAVRKLRGGMMPPPGARQPDRTSVEAFASSARDVSRSGGGGPSESWIRFGASTESRRVRQRHRGYSRDPRRLCGASSRR